MLKPLLSYLRKLRYIIFLSVSVLLILIASYSYYSYSRNRIYNDYTHHLRLTTDFKKNQIYDWLNERKADSKVISSRPGVIKEVTELLKDTSNSSVKENIKSLLNLARIEYQYNNIFISTLDGKILLSVKESSRDIINELSSINFKSVSKDSIIISKVNSPGITNEINLEFITPISGSDGKPIAAFILQVVPAQYLNDNFSDISYINESGEILILYATGDSIFYLNKTSLAINGNKIIGAPISDTNLSGVKAVLGQRGITTAMDYRGEVVFSYLDEIPGAPFYIVVKFDDNELVSELNFYTAIVVISGTSVILILILALGYMYSSRQHALYKNLFLAEKESREQEEEYKTTLYSIGDGVITTDKAGIIKQMNLNAEKLTGYTEIEAVGNELNKIFKIVNEVTGEPIDDLAAEIINGRKSIPLANNTLLISKDGKRIPISDSGSPVINDEGQITGVVIVFHDQSKEREIKNRLLESERRLSTMIDNIPGLVYRCQNNENWTMEFISHGSAYLTGYEPWELINDKVIAYNDIIFEEDREYVRENVNQACNKTKSAFEIEYRIITKSGEMRWVWEKGTCVYDGNGELIAIEGIIFNIHTRKTAELKIKENEELINSYAEIAKVGGWQFDPVSLMGTWTPIVARIHDLEPDVLYGSIVGTYKYYIGKSGEMLKQAIQDAIKFGKPYDLEVEMITEMGNRKWVRTVCAPELRDGKVVKIKGAVQDITEKKITEKKLRHSEERFRSIVEGAPDPIFIQRKMRFVYLNPVALKLLGANSPEEIIGKRIMDFFHPDFHKLVSEIVRKMDKNSQPGKALIELIIMKVNGEQVWAEITGQPIYYEGIYGGLVFVRDITNRKYAEDKLRETSEYLENLINYANAPIIAWNNDLKITRFNKSFEKLTGRPAGEVIGKSIEILFPPKEKNETMNLIEKTSIGEHLEATKINIFSKNGEVHTLLWNTANIFDQSHKFILATIAQGYDITELEKVQVELVKFSRAIEQSSFSIVITDNSGNIEYVNPYFSKLTGFDRQEVIGKKPSILKSGRQDRIFYKNLWDTVLSGNEWRGEMMNKKKNGDLFWVSVLISPVFNQAGEVTNFIALEEDITNSKKILEELLIAKEKAEESNRLKTAFLNNISHEIRTPLNGIVGFTNFLLDPETTDEERKEYAEIITQSSDRLTMIISDIIQMASLEAGQEIVNERKTNLNKLMSALFRQLQLKVRSKSVELKYETFLKDSDAVVMIDDTKVTQILTNLLDNAIKFTSKGEVKLTCRLNDEGTYLHFIVSDTGIGIAEEYQEVIFDRFRQVEAGATKVYGGNGLGLSISRAYAELMGGIIQIESTIGLGSTFYVTLPYKRVDEFDSVTRENAGTKNTIKLPAGKIRTVLVAEDEESNFQLLKTILKPFNFVLLRAYNGQEAVDECKKNPDIDLVLMDIRMPVMDGLAAMKKIKTFRENLPIIAVTAFVSDNDKYKFLDSGFDEYLTKPVNIAEFNEIVEKFSR